MVYVRLCVYVSGNVPVCDLLIFFLCAQHTSVCLNNLLMGVCFGVRTRVARFVVVSFLYWFGLLKRSLYCRQVQFFSFFYIYETKGYWGYFFLSIRSLSFTCFSLCLKSHVTCHTSAFIHDSYLVLAGTCVYAWRQEGTISKGLLFFPVIICNFVLSHDVD